MANILAIVIGVLILFVAAWSIYYGVWVLKDTSTTGIIPDKMLARAYQNIDLLAILCMWLTAGMICTGVGLIVLSITPGMVGGRR